MANKSKKGVSVVEAVAAENFQRKLACARRVASLLEQRDVLLSEGKSVDDHADALLREAALYQELLILEAAGQDPEHMAEMMDGMLMAAQTLAGRLGDDALTEKLSGVHVPAVEELDAMTIKKASLKAFQASFASVGALTKALMSIADDVGNLEAGHGGKMAEVVKTLQMAAGPSKEGTLGQALFAYDEAASPAKKSSFLSRSKPVSMAKKYAEAAAEHVKQKAPAAAKLLDVNALVQATMKQPIAKVVRAFSAYNATVAHYVDEDFLLKMAKQPATVGGLLRGALGALSGGGMVPTKR